MSNQRFSITPSIAVSDKRLSNSAFRTLAALGVYGDKYGWCWPSQATLSRMLHKSQQSISRDIKKLEELGYIQVTPRFDGETGARISNKMRILFDTDAAPTTSEVVYPTTSEVVYPTTSEVVGVTTSEVVKNDPNNDLIERPKESGATASVAAKRNTDNVPIPDSLNTPEFVEAWNRWKKYRSEIRKPLRPTTTKAQLKKAAEYGAGDAIKVIELSIENGWIGLFWERLENGRAAASVPASEIKLNADGTY